MKAPMRREQRETMQKHKHEHEREKERTIVKSSVGCVD
jgi:hypothetical protein